MRGKKIFGYLSLLVGLGALLFTWFASKHLLMVKGNLASTQKLLPNNPVVDMFGSAAQGKLAHYDSLVFAIQIAGILLVVLGLCLILFCRKK